MRAPPRLFSIVHTDSLVDIRSMARPVPSVRSSFGDTTYTKIFVGGLAWATQSSGLHKHFQQFGEILEAVVIVDKKSGRSKGYGFVTFCDPDAARRACLDPNPVIEGRRANCNLASLGRSHPPPLHAVNTHLGGTYFGGIQAMQTYVRRPPYLQLFPYGYQHGFLCSPYGYVACGAEYPSLDRGPPVSYGGHQYHNPVNVGINSTAHPFIHINPSLLSAYGYFQQGSIIPDENSNLIGPEDASVSETDQESLVVYSTGEGPSSANDLSSSQSRPPAHDEHVQVVTGPDGSMT